MARWLIWSEEHGAWWAGKQGYTRVLRRAGRFRLEEARELVERANEFVDPPHFHEIALEDPVPGYDAERDNISNVEAARRWPEEADEEDE